MRVWRSALWWVVVVAAVAGAARPAAAQTTEFYTDSAFATAWTPTDGSTTPATPLVEWGDTVWVKFQNNSFFWDVANPGIPKPVAKFERVDPAGLPAPANTPNVYGFKMTCNISNGANREYRVGVDFGFWARRNQSPGNVNNWRLGVPQRRKTYDGVNDKIQEDNPTAGESSVSGFQIPTGMPAQNIPEDQIMLTPGLWKVWAEQDVDGDGTPDASTAPLQFRVMNPIGVLAYDPYDVRVGAVGQRNIARFMAPPYIDTGGNAQPDPAPALGALYPNEGNGSPEFNSGRVMPAFSPTDPAAPGFDFASPTLNRVDHGRTSAAYWFAVCDRSKLYVPDAPLHMPAELLLNVRMGHGAMNPSAAQLPTNMDVAQYDQFEYPPIFADRMVLQKVDGGDDPRVLAVDLPRRGGGNVQPVPFYVQVRVLQYQPDTSYGTGWAGVESNAALFTTDVHDSDPIRVWYDFNKNDRLDRIAVPNTTGVVADPDYYPAFAAAAAVPASYEVPELFAEPYRELNVTINVPTDRRLLIDEKVVDLGKHPANSVLGNTPDELPAIRPFTVRNIGNVNLQHLRVGESWQDVSAAGNPVQRISMYSPGTEYDAVKGYGVAIAPAELNGSGTEVRRHFWWSFNTDPAVWTGAGPSGQEGLLRKARPGAPYPTTLAGAWTGGASVFGPRISVVSPFGQPVGTYASPHYRIFEDVNGDGVMNGRVDSAGNFLMVGGATSDVFTDPFTVKVSVIDRQLTEEVGPDGSMGVYGIDRRKVLQEGTPAGELRYAGDSQPAALRYTDGNERRLALFWVSNRQDARAPSPPANSSIGDTWYLYGSRTVEGVTSAALPWPYWTGSANGPNRAANDPEYKYPRQSPFAGLAGLETERYTSPALVPTYTRAAAGNGLLQVGAPYYLFFQGDAFTRQTYATTPDRVTARHAMRPFYVTLDNNMQPANNLPSVIGWEQTGFLKHGVRGLAYDDGTDNLLWSFWHGGADGQAKSFYTWRTAGAGGQWAKERRLPLIGDWTNVEDLVPLLWHGWDKKDAPAGQTREMMPVLFTGLSSYRKTTGIFMMELDPRKLKDTKDTEAAKAPRRFAPVQHEILKPATAVNNRVFLARNAEWALKDEDGNEYFADVNGTKRYVFPRIYVGTPAAGGGISLTMVGPDPETATKAAMDQAWTYNAADDSYTHEYNGYTSTAQPDLNGTNKVTIYPSAGVVSFAKPIDRGNVVVVDYVPQALRLTNSDQLEMAPSAFLDTREGPAQSPTRVARASDGVLIFPRVYKPRNRLWVFWTRRSTQVGPPAIFYKTMRPMVQLRFRISSTQDVVVTDTSGGGQDITSHVTIDAAKGRIYFPPGFEGHEVDVQCAQGTSLPGYAPQPYYVHWGDEQPETPMPVDAVTNDGKVCAFPDIAPTVDWNDAASVRSYLNDAGTWRTWVMWSSSRPKVTNSGAAGQTYGYDTDVRYLTLAPNLDVWAELP